MPARRFKIDRTSLSAVIAWGRVAAILIPALSVLLLPRLARLDRAAAWGLALLVSMAGWGQLIGRLAFPRRDVDTGLVLAWGAAAMLAVGGLLCLCSLATSPVLLTLVLGGTFVRLAHAVSCLPGRGPAPVAVGEGHRWPPGVVVALLVLAVLAAAQYLAGAAGSNLNQADDWVAYLVFPRKILASGSLIEPFSFRRITSYGGQSFLQALTLIGSVSPMQVPLLDLGISLVMVLALVLGGADGWTPREVWVLPVLFVLTLSNFRTNTASEISGVAFFLALYRTATWSGSQERPVARAAMLGLVAAAACTLRHSYLIPAGIFMVVLYLPTAIFGVRARKQVAGRRRLTLVVVAAAALVLLILPWALLSYRSNRTLLFPLFEGDYRPAFLLMGGKFSLQDRVKGFWTNVCQGGPMRSVPFLLLAGLAIPGRRTNGALPALLWASFAGFALTVHSLPLIDATNVARYYFGFEVATILAVMLTALALPWRPGTGTERARAAIPAVLVLVAVAAQLQETGATVYTDYAHLADRIFAVVSSPATSLPDGDESYRKLQASIPAGAPILTMLDQPFWLDFRRNRIDVVDLPGAVSPARTMPVDDDEALVQYLATQGYRYVAFVRSTMSGGLYRRDTMTRILRTSVDPVAKATTPFFVHMFDRFESLMTSRLKLYDDGRMVALDLGSRVKKR